MSSYALPVAFAVIVWWASTGVIIALDLLHPRTFGRSMAGGTAVLAACFAMLAITADDTSLPAAYAAFTCGLLAWGWQEMSFFMGVLTGPYRAACPRDARGMARFRLAVRAVLHHELAIVFGAAVIAALTWGGANRIGLWTYLLLWGMRQSAKLNVFLGVRNLNEQFIPGHLRYLGSFMARRPMNALFPFSVVLGGALAAALIAAAGDASEPVGRAGFCFLATLTVLAVVEHCFLVLPLPFSALWNWSLGAQALSKPTTIVPDKGGSDGLRSVFP